MAPIHSLPPSLGLYREQWIMLAGLAGVLGILGLFQVVPHLGKFGLRSRQKGRSGGVFIGSEWIPDDARLRHTHIVGATGAGKTVLLEQLIFGDLERGHGALIIDPKGDRTLFERIRSFCQSIGREHDLHLLSATYSDESGGWNPCRIGNASELQSKFFNSSVYSEPHYAKACELALLKAFNQLGNHSSITIRDVVGVLDDLSRNGKDDTMAGLFLDLSNLVQGVWGPILSCRDTNAAREISLLNITRKNEILFVDLPTEAQAVQSARIGRLLLQEIILISGMRKLYPHLRSGRPFSVFVDEFDAFAFPGFSTFLNKGRSSDFMIHLAHQTLSDLDQIGPAFRGQIMGNMNVRFIFRQDEPDDAEAWARFFGTRKVIKRTFQTMNGTETGMSSNRVSQEFRISPDAIKELQTGQCIFSMKTGNRFKKMKIPWTSAAAKSNLRFPVQRNQPSGLRTCRDIPPKDFSADCDRLAALFETPPNSKEQK